MCRLPSSAEDFHSLKNENPLPYIPPVVVYSVQGVLKLLSGSQNSSREKCSRALN
jgi:hypothetical protein